MKAILCTAYGSAEVLQVTNIVKPAPKENEVLIRIMASSVTAADGMMREGNPILIDYLWEFSNPSIQ